MKNNLDNNTGNNQENGLNHEIAKDKAFLVGVNTDQDTGFAHSMEELSQLARACNMEVVGSTVQNMPYTNKALYVGTGKIAEIREEAEYVGADMLIFNDSLTPSQIRNIKDETGIAVMDRTTLILEIFASRAKSREAMLQVEVARLQYMLPRLVGLHDALSRQGGASGSMSNKGAGEKKLELDRRKIEHRLAEHRKALSDVETERMTQQKKREKSAIPRVALVGYTNAGKSTIMNAMIDAYSGDTGKKVLEKDMLFATLDTSVRNITPKENKPFLLSDTVGFIDKLPHGLVKAFRSTLSEAVSAHLILHVVDFSDPHYKEQMEVTKETLKEIGASEVPVFYVFNKADLLSGEEKTDFPRITDKAIYMSARQGVGIPELVDEILKRVYGGHKKCTFLLPFSRGDLFSYLKEQANVLETTYEADGIHVVAECNEADMGRLKEYLQERD